MLPVIAIAAIAAGSAISAAMNENAKKSAISSQQGAAKNMADAWSGIYKDLVGQGNASYLSMTQDSGNRYVEGIGALNSLAEDKGGLTSILKALKDTNSVLGTQSGTTGKGVDSLVDPTILKVKNQMASDMSVAGFNLFGNFINSQNQAAQSNLSRLGNMAGGAASNSGAASQALVSSMGNYTSPFTGNSAAAVGAGISIADYLKRNSTGGTSNG
jgi:CheY-specific phosphatase CheX